MVITSDAGGRLCEGMETGTGTGTDGCMYMYAKDVMGWLGLMC
jgi:hypothetical protein